MFILYHLLIIKRNPIKNGELYISSHYGTNMEDFIMTNTNAALQVTNFDFYGDSLIAIRIMRLVRFIRPLIMF